MRLTVGPLPPAVYWRRRAIVLSVALAFLFVVFQACNAVGAPGEEAPEGQRSASPDPERSLLRPTTDGPEDASPDPTEEPPPDGGDAPPAGDGAPPDAEECTNDQVLVTAEASRTELTAGETVRFDLRIRNDSDRTCRRDVGGDHRELYLSAGSEIVWSSRACDPPTGSDERVLAPGDERAHHIDWDGRERTSCEQGPMVEPGEYELRARLGTDRSEPVTIVVR